MYLPVFVLHNRDDGLSENLQAGSTPFKLLMNINNANINPLKNMLTSVILVTFQVKKCNFFVA